MEAGDDTLLGFGGRDYIDGGVVNGDLCKFAYTSSAINIDLAKI